jgi:hypothetical protein
VVHYEILQNNCLGLKYKSDSKKGTEYLHFLFNRLFALVYCKMSYSGNCSNEQKSSNYVPETTSAATAVFIIAIIIVVIPVFATNIVFPLFPSLCPPPHPSSSSISM